MVFESQLMWFLNPTYIFNDMGLETGNYYVVPFLSLYYNYWDFLINLYGEMLDLWDKHKPYMEDRA